MNARQLLRELLDSTCICQIHLPPYGHDDTCEELIARKKAEAYLAENPQEMSDEQ